MAIRKLDPRSSDILQFQEAFCRHTSYFVPVEYFRSGDCYAMTRDGKIVAGYCLVHKPAQLLRSVQQIPSFETRLLGSPIPEKLAEFTGYFIDEKRGAVLFTAHLVWTIFFHKAKRFVYSYPVSQKGLQRYYGQGDPVRIYSGPPEKLAGHLEEMEPENVEILTKRGIFKIFWYRTKRTFRSRHGKRTRARRT